MAISSILDPIFLAILKLPVLLAVVLISFMISIIIVMAYRFFTDQKLMKSMKEEIKSYQKKVKDLKDNPEKAMNVQKKAMEVNMKYMMHSMKPTLFTFIPIIIIFGWLSAHLAFVPIMPGAEFNTTIVFDEGVEGAVTILPPEGVEVLDQPTKAITGNAVSWKLQGEPGEYILAYEKDGQEYTKELLISEQQEYAKPIKSIESGGVKAIGINNSKLVVLKIPGLGWELGWLGTYIIFSIVFSMSLRKLLKIY